MPMYKNIEERHDIERRRQLNRAEPEKREHLNSVYDHPSSQAQRAPAPTRTPMDELREAQDVEKAAMGRRQHDQAIALIRKHEARDARDGLNPHRLPINEARQRQKEHAELQERHAKEKLKLTARHREQRDHLRETGKPLGGIARWS